MRFAPDITLITGGASQTSIALSNLLRAAGQPVLFASHSNKRVPAGCDCVNLNWEDATTFPEVFDTPHRIRSVFLVIPEESEPLTKLQPFIELAIAEGVQRFILYGTTEGRLEKGRCGVALGRVKAYLDEQGVDYVALSSIVNDSGLSSNGIQKSSGGRITTRCRSESIVSAAFRAIALVPDVSSRENLPSSAHSWCRDEAYAW
ncbi:hypothetical protein NMY22_g10283 [Coprinellus aureogranulatus]|nr:hypothetical protein NMY22_g10283 [Coprinellus aureogranulatus]